MKILTVVILTPKITNSILHHLFSNKMPLGIFTTQGKSIKRMNAMEKESIGMTKVIYSLDNGLIATSKKVRSVNF